MRPKRLLKQGFRYVLQDVNYQGNIDKDKEVELKSIT